MRFPLQIDKRLLELIDPSARVVVRHRHAIHFGSHEAEQPIERRNAPQSLPVRPLAIVLRGRRMRMKIEFPPPCAGVAPFSAWRGCHGFPSACTCRPRRYPCGRPGGIESTWMGWMLASAPSLMSGSRPMGSRWGGFQGDNRSLGGLPASSRSCIRAWKSSQHPFRECLTKERWQKSLQGCARHRSSSRSSNQGGRLASVSGSEQTALAFVRVHCCHDIKTPSGLSIRPSASTRNGLLLSLSGGADFFSSGSAGQ